MSLDTTTTAEAPLVSPSVGPELDVSVAEGGGHRARSAQQNEPDVSASVLVGVDDGGDYESLFTAWKSRPVPVTAKQMLVAVADIYAATDAAGLPRPGRPTIQAITGATEHRVRCALQTTTTPPPPAASARRPDRPGATNERPPRQRRRQDTPAASATPAASVAGPVTTSVTASPTSDLPPSPTRPDGGGGDLQRRSPAQAPASYAPAASGARLVAWAGFVFGSLMSVAANVLATWLPSDDPAQTWPPSIAAQVGAAVWPIALLISVEVLSRVNWGTGAAWSLARYGGTGTVAIGAAIISYGHVRDVLDFWGYGTLAAHVGPLVIDGLMIVSGFALLALGRTTSTTAADTSSPTPPPPTAEPATISREAHPACGPANDTTSSPPAGTTISSTTSACASPAS
jgi:hypothetical protein